MALFARLAVAVGYTFAAWLMAGLVVYAGSWTMPAPLHKAVRYAGLLAVFVPVFRLYFRRPTPLAPAVAALLAVSFIALLDLYLIAPYFVHPYDVYLKFWDWQFPAMLVAGSIYSAGRSARQAQAALNQR